MTAIATAAPTVLIIDDEMGILDTIRILLKSEGFIPYTALGGKKGLEQIAALKPELIITDVRMPDVTGLDILASVRAHDPEAVGDPDDRAGEPAIGDRRGEQRRLLLHPETVQERGAGHDRSTRRRAPQPPAREQGGEDGDEARRQAGTADRRQQAVARCAARRRDP